MTGRRRRSVSMLMNTLCTTSGVDKDTNSTSSPTMSEFKTKLLRHIIYIVSSFSSIGMGKPSPVVSTKTKGVEPTVPDARRFLEVSGKPPFSLVNALNTLFFLVSRKCDAAPERLAGWRMSHSLFCCGVQAQESEGLECGQ